MFQCEPGTCEEPPSRGAAGINRDHACEARSPSKAGQGFLSGKRALLEACGRGRGHLQDWDQVASAFSELFHSGSLNYMCCVTLGKSLNFSEPSHALRQLNRIRSIFVGFLVLSHNT